MLGDVYFAIFEPVIFDPHLKLQQLCKKEKYSDIFNWKTKLLVQKHIDPQRWQLEHKEACNRRMADWEEEFAWQRFGPHVARVRVCGCVRAPDPMFDCVKNK